MLSTKMLSSRMVKSLSERFLFFLLEQFFIQEKEITGLKRRRENRFEEHDSGDETKKNDSRPKK